MLTNKLAVLALCLAAPLSVCAAEPARADMLTLQAQASSEVAQDLATMTLARDDEDSDAAVVSQRVSVLLEGALKDAKSSKNVVVRWNMHTYPVNSRKNKIAGWRAHADVFLESTDLVELSKLASLLSDRLQITNVQFSLSDKARHAEEAKLQAQAIEAFKDKAQKAATSFGYSRFSVVEVAVGSQGGFSSPRPMMVRSLERAPQSVMASSAPPIPIEPGTTSVTVNISGSVKMEK